MISSVSQHYDSLLAEHYDWMFGVPFETKAAEQRKLLEEAGVMPNSGGSAIDLGCGSGFQSVALHDLGYHVLALDSSEKLLGDLIERSHARAIRAIRGDIRELRSFANDASADVIVCMGDTLTHLSHREEVSKLFRSVGSILKPSGVFVVTYRDLAVNELSGLDRFLPVRSDEARIMTCFLEYEGPDTVVVNDLVYLRSRDGQWSLHKSAYRKLRLAVNWVCNELAVAGMSVTYQRSDRMVVLAAQKS
jgi:SAM-dependent methyltransferase